jgi:hypothetical protein
MKYFDPVHQIKAFYAEVINISNTADIGSWDSSISIATVLSAE